MISDSNSTIVVNLDHFNLHRIRHAAKLLSTTDNPVGLIIEMSVPPYSIAVGNPCRVVKMRFDDELIELLLKFKWWDKSIEEIEELMPILSCGDLEKVKKEIQARL